MSLELTHVPENMPTWMPILLSDDAAEVADNTPVPIQLLEPGTRVFIWNFASQLLGTRANSGSASHGVQLLERFLFVFTTRITEFSGELSEEERIKTELLDRLLLLAGVCIQLASKMSLGHNHLTVNNLKIVLQQYDLQYSFQEINGAEKEVLKALNFRIPLWTNVEKAAMMAKEVGMSGTMLEIVALVMDVTDYYRVQIEKQIKSIAFVTPPSSTSSNNVAGPSSSSDGPTDVIVRTLHLVAGAVAATYFFVGHKRTLSDPIPKVAEWTDSPVSYITCIRNIIMQCILDMNDEKEPSKKRPADSQSQTPKIKRQCRHS